jgi:7-cyano-7-deazaguanine synthase
MEEFIKQNEQTELKLASKRDKPDKAVIILSGGADSITLLYALVVEYGCMNISALSFNYVQNHVKELEMAKATCKKLKVHHEIIDLRTLSNIFAGSSLVSQNNIEIPEGHYQAENMKSTVVPNRNGIMLSIAMSYALSRNIPKIFYGAHAGDHAIYPDCRPEFVGAMQKVGQLCDFNKVEIHAPFLYANKRQIIRLGLNLNVDYKLTWTCYKGAGKPCGKCGSCQERLEAFEQNDARDPLEYES